MGRRKRTPEQQARRALIGELLSAANVQSMDDIQALFKETIGYDGVPVGCAACGGDYPNCKTSCPMFYD